MCEKVCCSIGHFKNEIIDLNKRFILPDKLFMELRDKIKTYIILYLDKNTCKFLITLYYGENHITILKSYNISACFKIIQTYSNLIGAPLKETTFDCEGEKIMNYQFLITIQ